MTADALAAALVADTYALRAVIGKQAKTVAELADATGLGLGKTRRLIQVLKLAGVLLEDGPGPRGAARDGRAKLFRLKGEVVEGRRGQT